MNPAAILSVEISDNALEAQARLSKYSGAVEAARRLSRDGIHTTLGGSFDRAAFDQYRIATERAARVARDRQMFKAQLGADFNAAGFRQYERAIDRAEAQTRRLTVQQQEASRKAVSNFFTGSRGSSSEERSFVRGTLRGTVGRGAGFIGGGLAGGLLGYVSASGIKQAIEGTTQLVKASQSLAHFTGMSTQSALQFETVAKALGTSTSGVAVGFRTLATATNNALTSPTKASVKAFQELGLSQAEVKAHSKDLGTLFGMVSDRLNQLPAGAERTALAAKLLGRNWQQLAPIIASGSQGMKDMEAQARALGVTLTGSASKNIEELHKAEMKLSIAQTALSMQFSEKLAPGLIKAATEAIPLAEHLGHELAPAFRDVSSAVADSARWLDQNKAIVRDVAIAYGSLKIIKTAGGWVLGFRNDVKGALTIARNLGTLIAGEGTAWERLTGFMRGSQSETQLLTVKMNELAASMDRVALAQKGVARGAVVTDAQLTTEAGTAEATGATMAGAFTEALGPLGLLVGGTMTLEQMLPKVTAHLSKAARASGIVAGRGGGIASTRAGLNAPSLSGYYHGISTSDQGIAGRSVTYHPRLTHHASGSGGGWHIPTHRAAHHAAARHMEFNPFTGTYQSMTSAQHQALRDRYIRQMGVAPPSSPPHISTSSGSHAAALARQVASGGSGAAAAAFTAPGQSTGFQGQMQVIQNALQAAQNANNLSAQDTLLNREMRLDRRTIGLDQAKLRSIYRQLHGAISKAKRSQLMADKLQLLQDIGSLRNDIGSAMSTLQNIAGGGSTGTFDLAPSGANITAPTIYDVRHSLRAGRMAAIHARHPAQVHHHGATTNHTTINVHVRHQRDVPAVADAIDRATGSQLHARLRAAGVRGT